MKSTDEEINAHEKEKGLSQELKKISSILVAGNDGSIEALYQLKDLLDKTELFEFFGRADANTRLLSVVWMLKKFIHGLWANLGGDNKGFPNDEGTKELKNIAKYAGIFIRNSLFMNRSRDSIGTFEDIIKSYYDLLRLCEEAYKKETPENELAVL